MTNWKPPQENKKLTATDIVGIVALVRPHYSRIVGCNENLHEVMLEAIEHGAYVWANPAKQRTCINTSMPNSKGWMKVHGTYTMPPLDAA